MKLIDQLIGLLFTKDKEDSEKDNERNEGIDWNWSP